MLQTSCSTTCPRLQSDYTEALAQEPTLIQGAINREGPVQFALAVKTDFLSRLGQKALEQAFEKALSTTRPVEVAAGRLLDMRLDARVLDLRLSADAACSRCLRVDATLDGKVFVDVPVLGPQMASLAGTLSTVAPLLIEPGENGSLILKLDTREASRLAGVRASTQLDQLPPSWARALQSSVSRLVETALSERLASVSLTHIQAPDLGIKDFRLVPTSFVTDPGSQSVIIAFTSNLPFRGGSAIDPLTLPRPADGQDITLAVRPAILGEALAVRMQQGTIARRYTLSGEAQPTGAAHITLNHFNIVAMNDPHDPNRHGLDLGFRVWTLGSTGSCFALNGKANGRIALKNGQLDTVLSDLSFSDSVLANPANWLSSQFLSEGKTIAQRPFDRNVLLAPGVAFQLKGQSLRVENDFVVLSATAGN
ncbi:MAG: hypothetical protein H0U74_15530 [Bradymonadaceae bacterium]|nr:hypothetical protein [Lujinxingiaceae bacterium]